MFIKPDTIDITIHKMYAEDGLELDGILFEPKKKTKKIIIHIHGKEGHFIQNHFVTVMGYTYPLYDYAFLTFNNRGHDYIADMLKLSTQGLEWVTRGTAYDSIEEAKYDINGVITYLQNLGFDEFILQGHSIGPHKICFYLADKPKYHIHKIILLSTADVAGILDVYVPEWRKYVSFAKKLIDQGKELELMPIRLWSNAMVSAKTYWDYTNENSNIWIFNFTSPEKGFKHFNKIDTPMIIINPENDFGCPGVTSDKRIKLLKKNTVSKKSTFIILKDAIHNFAQSEEKLTEQIVLWLKNQLVF
ncbi:MAG: DUF1749 domain-containing protein [Patescibacteria group bacterium]